MKIRVWELGDLTQLTPYAPVPFPQSPEFDSDDLVVLLVDAPHWIIFKLLDILENAGAGAAALPVPGGAVVIWSQNPEAAKWDFVADEDLDNAIEWEEKKELLIPGQTFAQLELPHAKKETVADESVEPLLTPENEAEKEENESDDNNLIVSDSLVEAYCELFGQLHTGSESDAPDPETKQSEVYSDSVVVETARRQIANFLAERLELITRRENWYNVSGGIKAIVGGSGQTVKPSITSQTFEEVCQSSCFDKIRIDDERTKLILVLHIGVVSQIQLYKSGKSMFSCILREPDSLDIRNFWGGQWRKWLPKSAAKKLAAKSAAPIKSVADGYSDKEIEQRRGIADSLWNYKQFLQTPLNWYHKKDGVAAAIGKNNPNTPALKEQTFEAVIRQQQRKKYRVDNALNGSFFLLQNTGSGWLLQIYLKGNKCVYHACLNDWTLTAVRKFFGEWPQWRSSALEAAKKQACAQASAVNAGSETKPWDVFGGQRVMTSEVKGRLELTRLLWNFRELITKASVVGGKCGFESAVLDTSRYLAEVADEGKSFALNLDEKNLWVLYRDKSPDEGGTLKTVSLKDWRIGDVRRYFSGRWFEEFVCLTLLDMKSQLKTSKLKFCPNLETNGHELDIVLYDEKRYIIVECKSGRVNPTSSVEKLENLVMNLRSKVRSQGCDVLGVMVYLQNMKEDAAPVSRIKASRNVACVYGDNLPALIKKGTLQTIQPGEAIS